jgi:hypothetical protein
MSAPSGTVSPMQSAQAKQRKQERKRLKRDEKRRRLQTSLPDWPLFPPWPNMTETFVDFAQPIIDRVRPGCELRQLRRALSIASVVWNAMVGKQGDVDRAVELMTRILAEETKQAVPSGLLAAIGSLALRKLARFDDDDRIVTGVEVQSVGDGIRVRAVCETPPPAVRMALWLRRLEQLDDDWPS